MWRGQNEPRGRIVGAGAGATLVVLLPSQLPIGHDRRARPGEGRDGGRMALASLRKENKTVIRSLLGASNVQSRFMAQFKNTIQNEDKKRVQ